MVKHDDQGSKLDMLGTAICRRRPSADVPTVSIRRVYGVKFQPLIGAAA